MGKPVERQGRKAKGLRSSNSMAAGCKKLYTTGV